MEEDVIAALDLNETKLTYGVAIGVGEIFSLEPCNCGNDCPDNENLIVLHFYHRESDVTGIAVPISSPLGQAILDGTLTQKCRDMLDD